MDNMEMKHKPDFHRDNRGIERNQQLTMHLNRLALELLDHGYFIGNQQWNQFNVMSPFGRIYYMIADHGWLETAEGRMDLEPGYMYLIPPYTKVNLRTELRIEKFYFHFSLRYANTEILEGINRCFCLPLSPERLEAILSKYQGGQLPDMLDLKGMAYETISEFIRERLPDLGPRMLLASEYRHIYAYVDKNLSARLSARSVCAALDMSYETMRRKFRKDHGITLNRYIQGKLIQQAALELLLTNKTIAEIATGRGYDDEFYFSRVFKQKMEYSPREYRRVNTMLRRN